MLQLVSDSRFLMNVVPCSDRTKKEPNLDFGSEESGEPGVGDKLREFLGNLRYFRIFIGIWNIVLVVLMLV